MTSGGHNDQGRVFEMLFGLSRKIIKIINIIVNISI